MRRWKFILVSLLCLPVVAAATDRLPVPDAKVQARALAQVRSVFKEEYSRHAAADRQTLAEKLLKQGRNTSDDPGAKYVLLKESAEMAASSGDAAAVHAAIEQMSADFEIDGPATEAEALSKCTTTTPEGARSVAEAYVSAVGRAISQGNYALAARVASTAVSAAKKTRDNELTLRAESLEKNARDLQTESSRFAAAQATLASKPENADANFIVGRFLCLIKGDWEKGLPLLAKGGDAAMKSLAERETSPPKDPNDQATLADAWYDASLHERNKPMQSAMKARAAKWYSAAAPNLSSLQKVRAEKRIAELNSQTDLTASSASGGTPSLAPLTDEERAALTMKKKDLIDAANVEKDKSKRLDTLIEAAKITLQLGDRHKGWAELEDIGKQATAMNASDQAGRVLIAEGAYLGSINQWRDAEAILKKVWTSQRGGYGNNGCAAAALLAQHCLDTGRPDAAVPYKLIIMDCGGSYGGPGGDAGLWLADYYLAKGNRKQAIAYLNLVADKYPGSYDSCAKKAKAKLTELQGGTGMPK
ncbi:MAG: hypothetical protein JWN24_2530 [Phycisphaerales bacterium]|nr:hypothetical protein [Phycisphaerales bacterium]